MARQKARSRRAPVEAAHMRFEEAALHRYGGPVAGVDEAGRGPLAGPVVAAAVVLDVARLPDGLADSKKLAPDVRAKLYEEITRSHATSVGIVGPADIDQLNILRASLHAMTMAVSQLDVPPGVCLVDGNRLPELPCPGEAIVKGDAQSLSIAAASIVAKVTRDRIMVALDADYPGYGWAENMGYPTPAHRRALEQLGATAEHRRSFAPVRAVLDARDRPA